MIHIATTPFGRRAVSAGLLASQALAAAPAPLPEADKWHILDNLRVARATFRLSDRDLSVLTALLSFLPGRMLADGAALVVHPSNQTLCDRANGMAESTLRRHLAALVAAGMIARNDSPNGKRYATRGAGGTVLRAFGFDLRPLLVRAVEIADAADATRAAALHLRMRRETLVLHLRDAGKLFAYARAEGIAADWAGIEAQLVSVQRALRRNLSLDDIEALLCVMVPLTATASQMLHVMQKTEEMIGNDVQIERHQHNSKTDSYESEPCHENGRAEPAAPDSVPVVPLGLVLKACPDILPYASGKVRSWHDLIKAVDFVHGMMGISRDAWVEAQRIMGAEVAATAVVGILQRVHAIRSPGAYLRNLTSRAAEGRFSVGPMIMALLTAENARLV